MRAKWWAAILVIAACNSGNETGSELGGGGAAGSAGVGGDPSGDYPAFEYAGDACWACVDAAQCALGAGAPPEVVCGDAEFVDCIALMECIDECQARGFPDNCVNICVTNAPNDARLTVGVYLQCICCSSCGPDDCADRCNDHVDAGLVMDFPACP